MRPRTVALSLLALTAAATLALPPAGSARTVWLCRPGQHPDPCTAGLATTVYSPTLRKLRVIHPKRVLHPGIDCFYVYPTVSGQKTGNANLRIDPEERSIALYQAARYSQYCRMFAPMYRQLTLAGIGLGVPTTKPKPALALSDVGNAFKAYLRHYNRGRGFVLIGHSQGTLVLRVLTARLIDGNKALRRRLVSAILLGGNVLVSKGRKIGGDFKHIPGCIRRSQLGCVIAFSSFGQPVPASALFGRPPAPAAEIDDVLCTNPAALSGGSGLVDPVFPSTPFARRTAEGVSLMLLGLKLPRPPTPWVSVPRAYRARCSSAGDANVLQISPASGIPVPNPALTPAWGLHQTDANIALGNLISIVRAEVAAFAIKRGR